MTPGGPGRLDDFTFGGRISGRQQLNAQTQGRVGLIDAQCKLSILWCRRRELNIYMGTLTGFETVKTTIVAPIANPSQRVAELLDFEIQRIQAENAGPGWSRWGLSLYGRPRLRQ